MRGLLPALAAALLLAACKKEAPADPPPPAQTESVPISNDPRNGAAMLGAAGRAADKAGAASEKRTAEVEAALEGQ